MLSLYRPYTSPRSVLQILCVLSAGLTGLKHLPCGRILANMRDLKHHTHGVGPFLIWASSATSVDMRTSSVVMAAVATLISGAGAFFTPTGGGLLLRMRDGARSSTSAAFRTDSYSSRTYQPTGLTRMLAASADSAATGAKNMVFGGGCFW